MFLIVEPGYGELWFFGALPNMRSPDTTALPQLRKISIVEAYERYVEGSPYGVTF